MHLGDPRKTVIVPTIHVLRVILRLQRKDSAGGKGIKTTIHRATMISQLLPMMALSRVLAEGKMPSD